MYDIFLSLKVVLIREKSVAPDKIQRSIWVFTLCQSILAKRIKELYNCMSMLFSSPGIHYVGQMGEGDELRILLDQVTEGQVSWSPLDRDFDRVRLLFARQCVYPKPSWYCASRF